MLTKDAETKKLINQFCLINFRSADDIKEFETEFQKALDELKSK